MSKISIYIKSDLFRYNLHGNAGFFRALVIPGFLYTMFFRRAQNTNFLLVKKIYKLIMKLLSFIFGFQIPVDSKIGYALYIGHHGTVIINSGVTMGNNCSLSPGVTIGQDNRGARKGCPVIGNKVWIGTNAVIVGKVQIGDDVLIVPNTFVNFDVPAHSIVLGNPGKILPRENATEGYISFVWDENNSTTKT